MIPLVDAEAHPRDVLIVSDQQYLTLLMRIGLAEVVAIDTETTGLHPYQNDVLRGVSITIGDRSWYLSISHPNSANWPVQPLIDALNDSGALQVYAHATYDWSVLWIASNGTFRVPSPHWDVQVVDWMLNENALSHQLKMIGARLFGADAKAEQNHLKALRAGRTQADLYKELRATEEWGKPHPAAPARAEAKRLSAASKKDWDTFTAEDIAAYAMQDTRLTWDIREWQIKELANPWDAEVDVRPDLEREFTFQRSLWRMIRTGIRVDPEIAQRHMDVATSILASIEAAYPDVSFTSVQDLGHYLYNVLQLRIPHRTASGAPSTDKAAMEELEGEHPIIEAVLQHRQLSKAMGTYFKSLVEHRGLDGRVHSAFNQARTVTGRLSSSDPNLQNIPTSFSAIANVREVFVPDPGFELWEFDLSQAELRVSAGWAGEQWLMDAIEAGSDLHAEVARSIWYPHLTAEEMEALIASGDVEAKFRRGLGKNINYSFQYGVGPKKLAVYLVAKSGRPITLEVVEEAREILDGYRRKSPALTRLMTNLANIAGQQGWIPLHVPGRYRRYKGPGYTDRKTYTALNSIVQGGVAEFLKDIMVLIEPFVDAEGGRICLQIHDSLVMELVPGTGPVVASKLQELTNEINPFRMRMVWDTKQWGDTHE